MNKKIEELAKQASAVESENMFGGKRLELSGDDIEKFALLIMDECASACFTNRCGATAGPEELIKERFGM